MWSENVFSVDTNSDKLVQCFYCSVDQRLKLEFALLLRLGLFWLHSQPIILIINQNLFVNSSKVLHCRQIIWTQNCMWVQPWIQSCTIQFCARKWIRSFFFDFVEMAWLRRTFLYCTIRSQFGIVNKWRPHFRCRRVLKISDGPYSIQYYSF